MLHVAVKVTFCVVTICGVTVVTPHRFGQYPLNVVFPATRADYEISPGLFISCVPPISYPGPWMFYAHAPRNQIDFAGHARKTSKALGTRLVVHKETGACIRGEILSRLSLSYTSMATDAYQRK